MRASSKDLLKSHKVYSSNSKRGKIKIQNHMDQIPLLFHQTVCPNGIECIIFVRKRAHYNLHLELRAVKGLVGGAVIAIELLVSISMA